MQILIPDSWLRDYLETNATPKQIQEALSLCGPSVERLHKKDGDYIYDVEVTTNRVDSMSIVGIAFECVAILPRFGYKAKLKKDPYSKPPKLLTAQSVDYLEVKLNKTLVDRFTAVLVNNVKVGPSPNWMVKRLELAGLRSLNNVVDISNYLMLEMGQPVHTFDYDKISQSKMTLRESIAGETLTTLDGKKYTLPGKDIVIADGSGKLIDLCGIMGGQNSAVDTNTKNVLLFVQVYEPLHIRKTSMSLANRTDAAVLFEKGLPVENVLPTITAGINLFSEITQGTPEKTTLDCLHIAEGNSLLKLEAPLTNFVNTRLGVSLEFSEIKAILKSLEFVVKSETLVEIPWARKLDVTIPEDLVEEVARIYGYHNLPTQLMTGALPTLRDDSEFYWISKLKSTLKSWGFTETYTYSLTPQDANPKALKLKNPLSEDWKYLRTSLASSLEAVVNDNLGRVQQLDLFEIANVYLPQVDDLPLETYHLSIATTRKDWLHLKGIVEALFNYDMGLAVSFNENQEVFTKDNCLIFETEISSLIKRAKRTANYTPISKFSPIIEDFNLKLTTKYQDLIAHIKRLSPLIQLVELTDKFDNKLTLRVTFHSNTKQLSKDDIAPIREKITKV